MLWHLLLHILRKCSFGDLSLLIEGRISGYVHMLTYYSKMRLIGQLVPDALSYHPRVHLSHSSLNLHTAACPLPGTARLVDITHDLPIRSSDLCGIKATDEPAGYLTSQGGGR